MSAYALVVGLLLAGQVNSLEERYSPGSGSQAQTTDQGIIDSEETGLTPLAGSSSDDAAPGNAVGNAENVNAPPGAGSPYSPPAGQSANGNSKEDIFGGSPPPFRGHESQSETAAATPPTTPPAKGLKPTAMMRAMLTAPPGSQLAGQPVPLVEAVAGASSRLEQTERVEAYWDLCSSVADYYLGLREQEELRRLRASARGEGAAWKQAEAAMAVRMDTSLKAARASQMRLAAWLGRGPGALPLPEDQPHCGSYHSRYEEVFAGRPSAEAELLSELLPLRYAELKNAASAVTTSEVFLNSVARKEAEAGGGTGTLRALEFLALRRRAFVQIARDYNRRIARYAELASPGEIGPDRLISMLIKTDNASTATRPGSSDESRRQSNQSGAPPRTFANGEGWEPAGKDADAALRDDAVRPAGGVTQQGPRRERSLLVSPRQ